VACTLFFLGVAYFFFPYVALHHIAAKMTIINIKNPSETKQKTLEEVAAAFGDRVIQAEDDPKGASVVGGADHVESAAQQA